MLTCGNNSMCLARGRSYTVPLMPMLRGCDQWHISDIADTMDGHLVSMAVLRRDLVRYSKRPPNYFTAEQVAGRLV